VRCREAQASCIPRLGRVSPGSQHGSTWSNYRRYCEAIDLIRPDGALAKDVLGNQVESRRACDRLSRDGYRDIVIPVWQARLAWDVRRDPIENGRLANRDPTLRACRLLTCGGYRWSRS
jgi:hypothetical protein